MLGIILIATGHPYYGRMAYNLALTIKAVEDIDITLVWDGDAINHLSDDKLKVFNKLKKLPLNFRQGFNAKLHLDELTPYDRTLFLDVDMLWLKRKPSELFEFLKGKEFACISEGDSDKPNNRYYFWADPEEIKTVFKVQKVNQLRSEVIYFEKTKVFERARKVKIDKLKTVRKFGELIPDELYFNIATADTDASLGLTPAYWSRLNNEVMPNLSVLVKEYFLLSFGSNAASPIMKRTYDQVMKACCYKLGLPYHFNLKSKKEWAPGRLKI